MELMKISKNEKGENVVSARELYYYLGYESNKFSRWATTKIIKNEFAIEHHDWEGLDIYVQGNKTKDYALSIDFGKRLAMMSRTEKGEQARNYFLECEKQLKANSIPQTLSQALYLAAKQAETIEIQQKQLELQQPKVEFAEQLLSATNSLDFGTSCKAMNLPFGRNRMFEICRELGFLMQNNQPYQEYITNGYFTLLETSFIHPKSGDRILTTKTMITAKGQNWLIRSFRKYSYME